MNLCSSLLLLETDAAIMFIIVFVSEVNILLRIHMSQLYLLVLYKGWESNKRHHLPL